MSARRMHIVAGGGPVGLMIALLLAERYPPERILLLEQSNRFGGLYNGFDYGLHGLFDNGMHVLYETGIPEIDTMLRGLLPAEEWNVLEGNAKDIAGIYWNGGLQTHSAYLDLRRLPESAQEACVRDFFATILCRPVVDDECITAGQYALKRFGKSTAAYLIPCLEKLYQSPASELSSLATRMPIMDRIILFDASVMENLMQSPWIRSRLAYPDQLALPAGIRTNKQAALYPKEFGMGRVIASMVAQLAERNIRCMTNSFITSMRATQHRISDVTAVMDGKEQTLDNIAGIYWTAGLSGLGDALGLAASDILSLPLPESLHINLRLNEPPDMGALYHFYCFDSGYHTFRVTNYANYCPQAHNHSGYPVCVELWPQHAGQIHDPVAVALQELRKLGVVDDAHKVTFSDVQPCRRVHAMFTTERVAASRKLRYDIKNTEIINLMWAGVMGEDNTLLLYEILRDAHAKLLAMY